LLLIEEEDAEQYLYGEIIRCHGNFPTGRIDYPRFQQ